MQATSSRLLQQRQALLRPRPFAHCRAAPRTLVAPRAKATNEEASAQPAPEYLLAAAVLASPLINTPAALAAGGEFGILEGRTAALIHPALMFFLFGSSVYAGYLGLQWRRTRDLATEIKVRPALCGGRWAALGWASGLF